VTTSDEQNALPRDRAEVGGGTRCGTLCSPDAVQALITLEPFPSLFGTRATIQDAHTLTQVHGRRSCSLALLLAIQRNCRQSGWAYDHPVQLQRVQLPVFMYR